MTARPGAVSIAELVLVCWLFAFVLAALASFATTQNRLGRSQQETLRQQELVRTARLVLTGELRYLARNDVRMGTPASVGIRAIRGGGRVCGSGAGTLLVRYAGARLPQPHKDSLLLVSAGRERVAAVENVEGATACGEPGLRIDLAASSDEWLAGATGGIALVFETGSYSVAEGAFRYRRGAGGRQPLTESLLASGELALRAAGSLDLTMRIHPDSAPLTGAELYTVRIPVLNLLQ